MARGELVMAGTPRHGPIREGSMMRWRATTAATVWVAVSSLAVPAGTVVHAAPAHSYTVWRIERVDGKPHRLKVRIAVTDAKPGYFFGEVAVKRVGRRDMPRRVRDGAYGYGLLWEVGSGLATLPDGDVDEGPVDVTTPACTELGLEPCTAPIGPGGSPSPIPAGVGWLSDTPVGHDFYAVLYDITTKGSPAFDKAYPGWRAVRVTGVSVNVVTKHRADATGVTNGSTTVEHFHRATVRSGRGPSVVQAILPCYGTSGPGAGSARFTNTAGLDIAMDCNHPLYVAATTGPTEWTLAGDVVGVNQQLFPYSRLIEVSFP